jgi:acyl-coenzyme A thioesterase PaaI-like protein
MISPAVGERFIARARVLKPGRTLTVCRADVFAVKDGQEKLALAMQATMITRRPE